MTQEYKISIIEDLKQTVSSCSNYDVYIDNDEIIKTLIDKEVKFPLISVCIDDYEYITDDDTIDKLIANNSFFNFSTVGNNDEQHVHNIDFTNTILSRLQIAFTILSKEVSDIVEFEKIICESYSHVHNLSTATTNIPNEKILFNIVLNNEKKIKRDSGRISIGTDHSSTFYQSIIALKCEPCVMFPPIYASAEIAFDKTIEKEVYKKAAAMEVIRDYLMEHYKDTHQAEINSIGKAIRDIAIATENPVRIWTYKQVYDYMIENNCDAKSAIDSNWNISKIIRAGLQQQAAQARMEEERMCQYSYEDYPPQSDGSDGIGTILGTAIGVAIGNASSRREMRKQTQLMEEQAKQAERAERERRHQEALESQRQWRAVKEANDERRRKGLPELPYPPRKWY